MADSVTGNPLVRVGRRFLPVAAATMPPLSGGGVVTLTVPAGTPVHAVAEGRVLSAEGGAVGEVVLRIDDEVRLAYRRLAPSSVSESVRQGQTIGAGDHVGVVARAARDGIATLELAATRADGSPLDVADLLVGAADPLELFLTPPQPPDVPNRTHTRPRPRSAAVGSPGARLTRSRGPASAPPAASPSVARPAETSATTESPGGPATRLTRRRPKPGQPPANEPPRPAPDLDLPTAPPLPDSGAEAAPEEELEPVPEVVANVVGDEVEPIVEAEEVGAPPAAEASTDTRASRLAGRRRRPERGRGR